MNEPTEPTPSAPQSLEPPTLKALRVKDPYPGDVKFDDANGYRLNANISREDANYIKTICLDRGAMQLVTATLIHSFRQALRTNHATTNLDIDKFHITLHDFLAGGTECATNQHRPINSTGQPTAPVVGKAASRNDPGRGKVARGKTARTSEESSDVHSGAQAGE